MGPDGYPDDQELKRIQEWPVEDFRGLMEFVLSLWWHPEYIRQTTPRRFLVSTAGWSGNESIISALQLNTMFWLICWQESRRGGHYKFELPKLTTKTTVP